MDWSFVGCLFSARKTNLETEDATLRAIRPIEVSPRIYIHPAPTEADLAIKKRQDDLWNAMIAADEIVPEWKTAPKK